MSSAGTRRRVRVVLPVLATVAIVAPLTWMWLASLMPPTYSVMDMGYPDYGGVQPDLAMAGHDHHQLGHRSTSTRSITELVADPSRPADVRVDLVARQQQPTGGPSLARYTLNGTSPGPEIRAVQGQLVEVHLHNESVGAGVTLHWHGVDVPNAMDGVAGVTQDAVPVGGEFTYRFVADQAGSFWYHSHQVSNPQVAGGLFGALVVTPKSGIAQSLDVSALAHTYGGVHTVNGKAEDLQVPARPGQRVRVRVTNTDNGPMEVWSSGSYRLLAIDGTDVHEPSEVSGRSLTLTAGARADLEVQVPADGSRGEDPTLEGDRSHRWTERQQRGGTAAAWREAGPFDVRDTGTARLRPRPANPQVRLRDRTSTRIRTRSTGDVVVDQRPHLSKRPDVRGTRGRRRRHAHREPQ